MSLRNCRRQSTSASVNGSFWAKIPMDIPVDSWQLPIVSASIWPVSVRSIPLKPTPPDSLTGRRVARSLDNDLSVCWSYVRWYLCGGRRHRGQRSCFKYPVGLVQSESGNVICLFDDFVEMHCQPNLKSDVRRQSALVIRQGCGVGNHMYGRSQKAL